MRPACIDSLYGDYSASAFEPEGNVDPVFSKASYKATYAPIPKIAVHFDKGVLSLMVGHHCEYTEHVHLNNSKHNEPEGKIYGYSKHCIVQVQL